MITLDEVLLNIEYDADGPPRGGPEFSTGIITVPAGLTQRNINRLDFIGRWGINYRLLKPDQLQELYNFFVCRHGMAYGFRFLAPEAHEVLASAPEQFGTGGAGATVFQLQRVHTSGPRTYTRKIVKPMAGGLTYVPGANTIKIYVNGAEQTSGVSVSSTTGLVTFTSAPSNGAVLTWSGQYHVPALFGRDQFEGEIDTGSTSVFGIDIVEVLPVDLGL